MFDTNSNRLTILHQACQNGNLDLVKDIVYNFPGVLAIAGITGKSPCILTVCSWSVELEKYLVSKGCDM